MKNIDNINRMEKVYQTVPLIKQSFLQKLFRQVPEENAIIELNNLLASKPVIQTSLIEVDLVTSKYRINLSKYFQRNIHEFYAVYINYCLKDKKLSEQELAELKHLKTLLNLSDREIESIHNKVAGSIYHKSIKNAISDGRLDEKEKKFLESLQKELMLPDEIANRISGEVRGRFINDYINKVISDQRLSPDEEQEIEVMSKSLMVNLKLENHTKAHLDKLKLYWLIENAELPFQDVNINLQKTEKCYFHTQIDWYEQRTITRRVNYGGPVARVKIMKGVYYRIGSVSSYRVTNEEWKLIDSGEVYLTNKRIIFVGTKKNSNIRLDKILSFTPYSDGIEIDKETGRSPLLKFDQNVEVFGMLLSRLLREV